MVKKAKRFIIFVLFSFFHSLLAGKTAEAAGKYYAVVVPYEGEEAVYNGNKTGIPPDVFAGMAAAEDTSPAYEN